MVPTTNDNIPLWPTLFRTLASSPITFLATHTCTNMLHPTPLVLISATFVPSAPWLAFPRQSCSPDKGLNLQTPASILPPLSLAVPCTSQPCSCLKTSAHAAHAHFYLRLECSPPRYIALLLCLRLWPRVTSREVFSDQCPSQSSYSPSPSASRARTLLYSLIYLRHIQQRLAYGRHRSRKSR